MAGILLKRSAGVSVRVEMVGGGGGLNVLLLELGWNVQRGRKKVWTFSICSSFLVIIIL